MIYLDFFSRASWFRGRLEVPFRGPFRHSEYLATLCFKSGRFLTEQNWNMGRSDAICGKPARQAGCGFGKCGKRIGSPRTARRPARFRRQARAAVISSAESDDGGKREQGDFGRKS